MAPRFLDTLLPFLAFPIALTLKRFPGPDDRACGGLDHDDRDRHDHPPADRLRERGGHVDALPVQRLLPADDRLRLRPGARLGRNLAVPARRRRGGAGGGWATPRLRALAQQRSGGACWRSSHGRLFAALAPTLLGIDHAGLQSIYKAGDHTAFNLKLHLGQHDTR